ncbi:MAG: EAL domain-containing protein [Thermodesulfovibrionales bacterium]|nr:EAL domain-containing protein [Thermodesulfovibrionales bacterium]
MNTCMRCEIISRIDNKRQDIYLSTSEPYLLQKIHEILKETDFVFRDLKDVIFIKDANFNHIIEFLHNTSNFTDFEKKQILIIPLNPDEGLIPQHLFSARTLSAWFELINAKDLIHVISNRSLTTFFQPIFTAEKARIFGFECLNRGISQDGRLIPPLELFGKADVLGLQFALDKITREMSIQNSHKRGLTNDKVFINFLPTAIYNPNECLNSTVTIIKKFEIKPHNLVFEVVESEQVKDIKHLKGILDYYRSMGFMTALDDFGSGYSSLKMLDVISPDFVKIDMHFIKGVNKDNFKKSVIEAIVSLCKPKNIKTIAEGIENYDEYLAVAELGVDLVQGYFFARPNPNINPDIYKPTFEPYSKR